jgi:transcriptional regulator with XRE-family HTH domain
MIDWPQIGAYLREARKARRPKMSQDELGEIVGVGQQAISYIERGNSTTLETLDAICRALDIELNVGFNTPSPSVDRYEGPPEIVKAAAALSDISPDERRAMIEVLCEWPSLPETLRAGILMQFEFWHQRYGSGKSTRSATA